MLLLRVPVLHLLDHLVVLAQVAQQVLHTLPLVLLILPEQLLLRDQVILLPPQSLDLRGQTVHVVRLLLLLQSDLISLLLPSLFQLGQVSHEPVVFLLMKFEFFLLCLRGTLLLLKLHRVLMHRIPVQELLVTP